MWLSRITPAATGISISRSTVITFRVQIAPIVIAILLWYPMTLTRPVAWRSTDLCGSHPRPVGIYTDSRCTRARARRSLKHLLAFTFNALHGQVVLAIYFVQLCRIYLGGLEPETE